MAFKLKSQAAVSEGGFKMMGSSPLTMRGHEPELPRGHIHPGGDDTKWEVKDEIKNDDGSITVETRSGQTGSEGKPASTKTITTPVPTDPIPTAEGGVQTEDPEQHWREVGTKHGDIYQKRPILDFFQNLKSKFGKGRTSGGKSCGPNDKGPGCEAYD